MLTLVLCLVAATQGQYVYPPASTYTIAGPVVQPNHSGRLQAIHFRSGPYPPAEPPTSNAEQPQSALTPVSSGPYPPALAVPPAQPVVSVPASGPYPPALPLATPASLPVLPLVEGGEVSPVESDSPRVNHLSYSLPSLASPANLEYPPQSNHLHPVLLKSPPIKQHIPFHQTPVVQQAAPALRPLHNAPNFLTTYLRTPNQLGSLSPSQQSESNLFHPTQSVPNVYHTIESAPKVHHPVQSAPSIHHTVQPVPNFHHPVQPVPNFHHPVQSAPSIHHPVQPVPTLFQPTVPKHNVFHPPQTHTLTPNNFSPLGVTHPAHPPTPNRVLPTLELTQITPPSYPLQPAAHLPTSHAKPNSFDNVQSTHPIPIPFQNNPAPPTYVVPIPSYSPQAEQTPSQRKPVTLSGGEVSPEELEIPPNTRFNVQDNRLQYNQGFSDDKGTAVREQGSLLSTNGGWEYVIQKKGSYSYTSPEGKLINVKYIADHNGYRVIP